MVHSKVTELFVLEACRQVFEAVFFSQSCQSEGSCQGEEYCQTFRKLVPSRRVIGSYRRSVAPFSRLELR